MERRKHKLTEQYCLAKRCCYYLKRASYNKVISMAFRHAGLWNLGVCSKTCYHKP